MISSLQDKQAEMRHNRRIFDKAEVYWSWGGTAAGLRRGQRRVEMYLEYLKPCPGQHFLEYGCGMGWFTRRMESNGARITAFDIQEEFVQVAQDRSSGSAVRHLVADSEFLPFSSETFDGIYGTAILHHVPMQTTLSELKRVLRPGGKMIFTEPNMLNPQIMVMKNIKWIGKRMGESPNETAFFRWEMLDLLRQSGFQDIRVEPFDFLHPSIPARLLGWVEPLCRTLENMPFLKEIAGSLDIRAVKA